MHADAGSSTRIHDLAHLSQWIDRLSTTKLCAGRSIVSTGDKKQTQQPTTTRTSVSVD
jgi:hypothetical protein